LKIGEIAGEGRRRLMDDEKPRISWEKDFKYKRKSTKYL
jgi:hypothetical protein